MTVSVLKVHFKKLSPTKLKYRSYKNFYLQFFKDELKTSLESSEQANTHENFKYI